MFCYSCIYRAHSGGVRSVTKRPGAHHKLYNALVHHVQPAGELSTMHTIYQYNIITV